ncbi:MAG: ATPase [Paenibacillaceae bacterium]|jgi:Cu+-exporting ATPase|nr:ATPase [Paenibacillaceae bacterium]
MTTKQATMQITGMSCAACAARIERGLGKVEGVAEANVNLALERASVSYDPGKVTEEELEAKIESLGFGVAKQALDLTIGGMSCAACAARIEKGVSKLPGVTVANVNLALETAHVEWGGSETAAEDVIRKITQLGFTAARKKQEREDAGDRHSQEISRQKATFWLSAALSFPLLWSMVGHFSWTSFLWVPAPFMNPWVQLALSSVVQFWIGWQFYTGAYKALRNGGANMDVLVALGTSAAFFYSLYLTVEWASGGGGGHHLPDLYYETSAVLITLILLGKLFEAMAKGRTSEAIKTLMGLAAKTATVIREGTEQQLPIEQVVVGDVIVVKPGEKIPVDAVVLEGHSAVDESMITGESIPVDKLPGQPVTGATINKHGSLRIRAVKVGKETALAQIIRVVEEAQSSKAPIQRVADRISGIFVPVVVALAAATFLVWYFAAARGEFTEALEKAIAVLVIACPCALGLATPTSIMAGSGRAAESGILFKGGEHLELTQGVDTVVLDKTGTVTHGQPELTDVILPPDGGLDTDGLLSVVAAAEKLSEHPMAEAIVKAASERNLALPAAEDFQAIPGYGIRASVEGRSILVGTRRLLGGQGIDFSMAEQEMERLEHDGKTAMLVAADGQYAGIVAVADTIKDSSRRAVERLHKLGLSVIMITGDNKRTAEAIARQAGIKQVLAEVLPEGKAEEIKKLQQSGKKVAMAGDGINDAPALATADIGMAMGTGTDVAIAAADVTLLRGDLNGIADAIYMSRRTMGNIKQNLFWALAYNSIGIPIAAAGFLAPWLAGAAMAMSSVSVVLNALRLQRIKL